MSLRLPLAAALVLVAAATALGVDLAGACSCAGLDARDRLADGDPAVLGEVVSRRPIDQTRYGPGYEYTVRVERDFNADLGSEVVIGSGSNGGACGFTWEVGDRIGAFLERVEGDWTTNLCSLVDPAELEAALRPFPLARGKGRLALLAGGSFADARLMALDIRGRVLGYGFGRGDVDRLSVCPGSRRAAELVRVSAVRTRVAVRDLRTLEVVRSVPAPANTVDLRCTSSSGGALVAAAIGYPGKRSLGRARVLRLTVRGPTTIASAPGDTVALAADTAYVANSSRVLAIDLTSGASHALLNLRHVGALAPSPDGTRLAVSGTWSGTRLFELPGGRPLGRVRSGQPSWLGSDRLLVRGVGRPRLYDADLRPLRRLAGFRALGNARVGRRVFGVDRRRLLTLDLGSGRRRTITDLPDPDTAALVTVPGSPSVRTSRRAPGRRAAPSSRRRCSAGDQPS